MIRVLQRLAILWAIATGIPMLLMLFHNWGHFYEQPNYYAIILVAFGPLILVRALGWAFQKPY